MKTQITTKELAERVGLYLRSQGPAENITGWRAKKAEILGCDEDTFYNWYMGDNAPQAHYIIRLAGLFGTGFADAILESAGLETFPIGSESKRHELGRFIASLATEHEDWAKRLRDEAGEAGVKLRAVK